ncbi:MAG: hypothetical protein QY314_03075 [Candidatus Dojkabacteria bacterium]|nr:MAG: hypothetical protein QY314_03075 [Candidatus Dojkabacteria bacterium]
MLVKLVVKNGDSTKVILTPKVEIDAEWNILAHVPVEIEGYTSIEIHNASGNLREVRLSFGERSVSCIWATIYLNKPGNYIFFFPPRDSGIPTPEWFIYTKELPLTITAS